MVKLTVWRFQKYAWKVLDIPMTLSPSTYSIPSKMWNSGFSQKSVSLTYLNGFHRNLSDVRKFTIDQKIEFGTIYKPVHCKFFYFGSNWSQHNNKGRYFESIDVWTDESRDWQWYENLPIDFGTFSVSSFWSAVNADY